MRIRRAICIGWYKAEKRNAFEKRENLAVKMKFPDKLFAFSACGQTKGGGKECQNFSSGTAL
jgi:hypothetical protein